jgi:hypothetical protein
VAAVAYTLNDPWVTARRARHDSTDRSGRADARVYRRRRAVAALALAAVALVAAVAVRLALAGPGGGALTTSGPSGAAAAGAGAAAAGAAAPAPGHVYVVQPGDSIWSIVQATGHRGDPRPLVDRLALQLNGQPLHPGQRLLIP